MSDVEHELLTDVSELRALVRQTADVAQRALEALRDTQDTSGRHEAWIDDALADVHTHLAAISHDADTDT